MLITASWEGGDVAVEVDEGCRSVDALRHTLAAALPELDAEKVCLEIGGCAADDEAVCSLCEGSVVTVSVTPAVRAVAILQEEGWDVDLGGFCDAAAEGDMRLCELYLDAEVHLREHETGCNTPLHIACRDNLPLCKLLIERGHPLNAPGRFDLSPLHIAVSTQSVELCELLIDRGCSVDVRSLNGRTPLSYAVTAQSVELCKLLIDSGAAANLTIAQRRSLFDVASRNRSCAVSKFLIDHGVSDPPLSVRVV